VSFISYATLGAFMKYRKKVCQRNQRSNIADKSMVFFKQIKNFFSRSSQDMGMIPNKSDKIIGFEETSLAYLVEAADDICYTIDFEDGINLGLVSEDFALEYLIKLVKIILVLLNTKL
jgi:dGTPase